MADTIGPGEAARRLGVSTRTVQRWLRDGRLTGVRVGSRLKVATESLPVAAAGERQPIRRLLVANRGELVVRIARTCRRLGITCIGLAAEDQARAWWTGQVDELAPLSGSYLDRDSVIAAARAAGADAIHPGYGFLAESADFAEHVIEAGMAWVGPPPAAMRALGDKAAGRRLAAQLGIPVLPGYDAAAQSDAALRKAAAGIGYPLLVKPSAGGGGMGMHVVEQAADMAASVAQARREARAAFGDDRLVLERYLTRPRHIELQLLADSHGHVVHLGERECSLQRRHQKVIEEAPSSAIGARLRRRLGDAAIALARAAGYIGAGTAEFLLDADGNFYFLEVNARLQVEHPVTEAITGRDLVAAQLAVAAGRPLGFTQADISFDGHAIEARLYAEDPYSDFLPVAGEVLQLAWPAAADIRVDAGVGVGDVIGTRYDPLLAKLIAHGVDRKTALDQLHTALVGTHVLGITTNRGFLDWLISQGEVVRGRLYTGFIDQHWQPSTAMPEHAWPAAAAVLATTERAGFRLNFARSVSVQIDDEVRSVTVAGSAAAPSWALLADGAAILDLDGRHVAARLAPPPTVEAAVRHAGHHGTAAQSVTAPMPGSVLAVNVAAGDEVDAGQVLVVLEAMKMENAVVAPAPARVERVLVEVGRQVARGEPLVELA